MKWVNVPAHRILKVSKQELSTKFKIVNKDDDGEGGYRVRVIRIRDGKVFREPRWHQTMMDFERVICLEEV